METFACSTEPDPTKRTPPQRLSSVFMAGNWAYHAYYMSHDGEIMLINHREGLEVQRRGRPAVRLNINMPYSPRDIMWGPDNKRFAFWAPPEANNPGGRRVAIIDATRVTRPDEPPPIEIIYDPDATRAPFGIEWSPKGDAVFVIESMQDPLSKERFNTIMRVDLNDISHPKEIVRMSTGIDFFMPPTSRFESGQGETSTNYRIVFGHEDGLFIVDPDGKRPERVAQVPATGLYNVEWSPDPRKEIVALFFRRASTNRTGRTFRGVWLIDLRRAKQVRAERAEAEAQAPATAVEEGDEQEEPVPDPIESGPIDSVGMEQLYDGTDVHTLWFSSKGTYVTWATHNALCYRRVTDAPDKTVRLEVQPVDGVELAIKGATWHRDERKLAFTAGNRLYLHEAGSTKPPLLLAEFGNTGDFCAEPRFVGEQIYMSLFGDMRARMAQKKRTMLGGPGTATGQETDGVVVRPNPVTSLGAPAAGTAPPGAPAPGTAPAAPPAPNPPPANPPRRPTRRP